MTLPTAYLPPLSYFHMLKTESAEIEVMESFEKQTFRNRCQIRDAKGDIVRLSVPVKKVEHKQLTRDIEISYQSRWQHQHWITLVSAYQHTPYFAYYADCFHSLYTQQTRFLIDLNDRLTNIILDLLRNEPPQKRSLPHSQDWRGQQWTDQHPWQNEMSIIDTLFEKGPLTNG